MTKEVHYFDLNWFRGERWYRSHFPSKLNAAVQRRVRAVQLVPCEASPYYLFHPLTPARAARDACPTRG